MASFVRAHPLATYLFLAFALSWWPWPFSLLNPDSVPMIPWGPLIATIIVVALAYGRAGLGRLLRATFKWRAHPLWYAVALGVPLLLWGGAAAIVMLTGQQPDFALLSDLYVWPATLLLFGIVQGPLTEEPGWRGLALPLMLRRMSPLVASLVLGAIWVAWHAPLLLGEGGEQRPLLPYVVSTIALSVLLTGIVLGTRGSVFIAIIFHSAINATAYHLVPAFPESVRETVFIVYAVLTVVAAVLVSLRPWFRHPDLDRVEAAPYEMDELRGRQDPRL